MNLLDCDNYIEYLEVRKQTLPNRGRGEISRLARLLNISSVAMSHIFSGKNSLNLDQALLISEDLAFNEIETEYFFTLVEIERAKGIKLKKFLQKKLIVLRNKGRDLKKRVRSHEEMSEEALAKFYSDWIYSGVRVLSAIPEFKTDREIADYYQLSLGKVRGVLEFLKEYQLVVEEKGELKIGIGSTHLTSNSPFINNHRRNWRLKGIEKLKEIEDDDLFYAGPMAISESGKLWLREELLKLIKRFTNYISEEPGDPEVTVCLNIDLFRF